MFKRRYAVLVVLLATLATMAHACGTPATTAVRADRPASGVGIVSPVSGPSWLHHLSISMDETKMGQMGGTAPPGATGREPALPSDVYQGPLGRAIRDFYSATRGEPRRSDALNGPFAVTGKDLYRLNCQSCHAPDGTGAPPEINSLIGPVQGMSPALIEQRLAKLGRTIDPALAKNLAAEAERPLRERLTNGGKEMPRFRHLGGAEVGALLDYLKQLAHVPEAPHEQTQVTESAARVGEHLAKGTCHICHDATGPGSGHMMMMQRVIPSLASFPEQKSVDDVVRKVLEGGTGMMGMMGMARMPVLPYLTEPEVAAAYLYLATYVPRP
jgi:mono/diheme cytochrome c family protein